VKTGVKTLGNYLKILDSGFCRNDKKGCSPNFYDFIKASINLRLGKSKMHQVVYFDPAKLIVCMALNCVSLSIGSSVAPITLFIIGVMEYWSDGPKRTF
jgi:hypothetical protein